MSILDISKLDGRQELISLAVMIICPQCDARVLAIGNALKEVCCPNCKRPYTVKTRDVLKECIQRNTNHRG